MSTDTRVSAHLVETLQTALGRRHRPDPVAPRSGGPAGNARLTAWLGLTLLVLIVAELVTVLDVKGMITWHIAIGVLLIPPSLAKTASTGWRILRYYTGAGAYVEAGPPPLLLRALGPFVVIGTLGVLGSGVLVTLLGRTSADRPWFHVLGNGVSPLTLHQASVIVWAVATGLHVLVRLVPALRLVGRAGRSVPGAFARFGALAVTAVAAAVVAILVLGAAGDWTHGGFDDGFRHHPPAGP
jgi:hypothetical protein